jgi:carboxyl-terminal processing protease
MNKSFQYAIVSTSACVVGLLLFGAVYGRSQSSDQPYRHLGVFTEVLSRIKSEYVEEPNMKNVTQGAIHGLLESLDPFASYLTADQYKQYLKERNEKKGDVGILVSKRFGYMGVVASLAGSPAAREGITTGDVIEAINNISTRDMPLAYAELLLQGDPGTSVEITLLRVRKPEPQKLKLVREVFAIPGVKSAIVADGIGHLQVMTLDSGRARDAATAIAELTRQGARKLVVDLRNCALGDPHEGIALANLFIEEGLLGYVQGQTVARQDFRAAPAKAVTKLPIAVLANRGTANGCEVAAGALLDARRGDVLGERTYGSAAIRKAITLEDGSAVLMSVAKFYSPAGKALQDTGVTPSLPVADPDAGAPPEDDDDPSTPPPAAKPSEDVVLKKAIEVLNQGAAKSAAKARFGAPREPAQYPAAL